MAAGIAKSFSRSAHGYGYDATVSQAAERSMPGKKPEFCLKVVPAGKNPDDHVLAIWRNKHGPDTAWKVPGLVVADLAVGAKHGSCVKRDAEWKEARGDKTYEIKLSKRVDNYSLIFWERHGATLSQKLEMPYGEQVG